MLLRRVSSVTPGQELVEACDFVVDDLDKDPSEPDLWIDVVQLGGFDESEGDCHGLSAAR